MDGCLWVTNPPMALTLAASMPSGLAPVVRIRQELREIIGAPVVPDNGRLVDAAVVDFSGFIRPWPMDFIYVGHGPRGCGVNPSPWGSPFVNADSQLCRRDARFVAYGRCRADRVSWLRPLINKNFVCHCKHE